jgi:hypothetical protein
LKETSFNKCKSDKIKEKKCARYKYWRTAGGEIIFCWKGLCAAELCFLTIYGPGAPVYLFGLRYYPYRRKDENRVGKRIIEKYITCLALAN